MSVELKHINTFLSFVAIALGLYIALSPFIPQLLFLFRDTSPAVVAPYQGRLAETNDNDQPKPIPIENRLVIPALSLDEPVKEGSNIGVINEGGTWRRPNTSTPDQGGNTVIVGHRYFASRASTFYSLDKVASGDQFAVYWDGQEYLYEVQSTGIVDATEVGIEAPSEEDQLTLYTCHPLWTAEDRLVIKAIPVVEEV